MKKTHVCLYSRGFSLMEFAVVIVIAGIVFAVALLYWPSPSLNVNQQAYQLAADLRYAQHLAQANNERLIMNFNSSAYNLTLINGTTAVNFASGISTVTLPSGMTLSTSNLATAVPSFVVFDGLGRPYTTNTTPGTLLSSAVTLTLTYNSQTATVTLQPNTGAITP